MCVKLLGAACNHPCYKTMDILSLSIPALLLFLILIYYAKWVQVLVLGCNQKYQGQVVFVGPRHQPSCL